MKYGQDFHSHGPFHLPPNHPKNPQSTAASKFQMSCGAPVWSHKDFKGFVYPENAVATDFLKHYAQISNAIELNSSFYAVPGEQTVSKWLSQVSSDFRFYAKFPERVSTHLTWDIEAQSFLKMEEAFGEHQGQSFLCLDIRQGPKEFGRPLLNFLDRYPEERSLAVEVRQGDWFRPREFNYLCGYIAERNHTLVMTDTPAYRDRLHSRLTGTKAFVRFLGQMDEQRDHPRLLAWADRICEWKQRGLEECAFFAHQEDERLSFRLMDYFSNALSERGIGGLPEITFYEKREQLSLF